MKKRGIGVGSMFYGIGYGFNRPDIGAAHVEVAEDGTATLYTGVEPASVRPVVRTSAAWAAGSAPRSHSITRVAASRFSFAITFV